MSLGHLNRRELITLAGGAAAWPFATHAQQAPLPVVGFLHAASAAPFAHVVAGLRAGLRESGYVEGQNLAIEFRWADGQFDRLPALAAELVAARVSGRS